MEPLTSCGAAYPDGSASPHKIVRLEAFRQRDSEAHGVLWHKLTQYADGNGFSVSGALVVVKRD